MCFYGEPHVVLEELIKVYTSFYILFEFMQKL